MKKLLFSLALLAGFSAASAQYCIPDALDCNDGDIIYNVTFAGINNDSDCSPDGYGDFTDTVDPAQVEAGGTYEISMDIGAGWYEKVSMWIDFNNDMMFDDDERFDVVEGDSGGIFTNEITIPADVANGTYRMRIYLSAAGASGEYPQDPCVDEANEIFGEIEDYMVQVGTLAVSDLNKNVSAVYPNPVVDTFNVNLSSKFNANNVTVTLTDMTGKTVRTFGAASSYNVSDLAAGVYVVKITDGQNTETKKIVKK